MDKASEKKISIVGGSILILSELVVWTSPKLGWDLLRQPELAWGYFLSAVIYLGFLFQIWKLMKW